jgi:hypothetical protein
VEAPRSFSIAFVLVVRPDQARDQALDRSFSDLVDRTVSTWESATSDLARLEVRSAGVPLRPGVGMGDTCPNGIVDCDPALATACVAPKGPVTKVASICTVRCLSDAACPVGYCCQAAPGGNYCLPPVEGSTCGSGGPADGGAEPPRSDGGAHVETPPGIPAESGCQALPWAASSSLSVVAAGLLLLLLLVVALRS